MTQISLWYILLVLLLLTYMSFSYKDAGLQVLNLEGSSMSLLRLRADMQFYELTNQCVRLVAFFGAVQFLMCFRKHVKQHKKRAKNCTTPKNAPNGTCWKELHVVPWACYKTLHKVLWQSVWPAHRNFTVLVIGGLSGSLSSRIAWYKSTRKFHYFALVWSIPSYHQSERV